MNDLECLLPYANELQAEKIRARMESKSNSEAARKLGCSETMIRRAIKNCRRKQSLGDLAKGDGWTPMDVTTLHDADGNVMRTTLREQPDDVEETGGFGAGEMRDGGGPYVIKGLSTYFNANGEQRGQWVKTRLDDVRRDLAIRAALAEMCRDIPPVEPIAAPAPGITDLLNVYTLTDGHVGMLAWHREGGEDWDLQIAEDTIVGCFAEAIRQAPQAAKAVFNQLGDLLHYDGLTAVTPTSGHILDADSRFTKMVESAVRIIRRIIALMLAKHSEIHVIMAEGNHDMASSVWLRTMMKALYENEPRITVDDSALPYYALQWGETMLGFHHSHLKRKFGDIRSQMAAQFGEMWGATKKRYCHTGDKHHASEKDEYGMHIIQHPTLAARDAYAARGGWHSQRFMQAMTFHKRFGLVGRVTVCPEMLAS